MPLSLNLNMFSNNRIIQQSFVVTNETFHLRASFTCVAGKYSIQTWYCRDKFVKCIEILLGQNNFFVLV